MELVRGTFGEGLDRLNEHVGTGRLKGSCRVNQVYAKYQHERADLRHPDGGQAFYLRDPLFSTMDESMQELASKAFESDGGLKGGMKDWAEKMSRKVFELAPLEFGDLKASGHPKVEDNGATIYDRPPNMHRLSEEELRIKGHLRSLFGRI